MTSASTKWISENWQALFGVVCTVAAAGFALLKWIVSRKSNPAQSSAINTAMVSLGAGASVSAPVIAGSNNVQNVTMHVTTVPLIPTEERKPISPTPEDIFKKARTLPPYQQEGFLNHYVGLEVKWPLIFKNIWSCPENLLPTAALFWTADFRYGNEDSGARVVSRVDLEKYPKFKILESGSTVWVEGTIIEVGTGHINVRVSTLDFDGIPTNKNREITKSLKEALKVISEGKTGTLDEGTVEALDGLIEVEDVTPLENAPGDKEFLFIKLTPEGKRLLRS